jgi:hypothetical protein
MVFNATFNNISVISLRSVLLVDEIWIPRENQWPAVSHWQTLLSHMLYWVHLAWAGFELTKLVVIGTDCISSYKSNYYTITTTKAPCIGKTIIRNISNTLLLTMLFGRFNKCMTDFTVYTTWYISKYSLHLRELPYVMIMVHCCRLIFYICINYQNIFTFWTCLMSMSRSLVSWHNAKMALFSHTTLEHMIFLTVIKALAVLVFFSSWALSTLRLP